MKERIKKKTVGTRAPFKEVSTLLNRRSRVPPIRTLFKNISSKKHLIVIAEVMNVYRPKQ